MRKSPSVLLALALAGSIPASATVYWVPAPEMGGARNPQTHLEVTGGGTRRLELAFIDTGESGVDVTGGTSVNVDNDVKPNVFNATRHIGDVGMLRIENDPGPNVAGGSLLFDDGPNSQAWAVPVLSQSNWFEGGETAYIQGLKRTRNGHANIEIMNFAPRLNSCNIQLIRPKGTPIGSPLTIAMLPVSHRLLEDVLEGVIPGATAAGLRATVTCEEPFYAYGTFVDPDPGEFRFQYPLSAPPAPMTEPIALNRPGNFFSPKAGNSSLVIDLPLVKDVAYRKVTVEFDMRISQFTSHFTGIVGMSHKGGQRFNRTLYFGTFARGMRQRSMFDLGSPIVEPSLRVATNWREGATHHITIVYDTESATSSFKVTRGDTVLVDVIGSAYNLDLAHRGDNPVKLSFGLPGVSDGAYFPPIGWKFSNLQVRIYR